MQIFWKQTKKKNLSINNFGIYIRSIGQKYRTKRAWILIIFCADKNYIFNHAIAIKWKLTFFQTLIEHRRLWFIWNNKNIKKTQL